ncbi:hypothetical protein ACOMCU_16335 [Lysinibacillus sp. UGB7]|uniref:hypothetical protein n=1 Tax=Lysinibacillus sp. UGB7 TaxID=3411039 RepID=UPI003B7FF60A
MIINENDIFEGEVAIRVKELEKCIYCDEQLPGTEKEHIFNSCWGGIHKTGQIICNTCNSHFSSIDGSFNTYTKYIMNAWEFKGQRHKAVPVIKADDGTTIESGGKPKKESKIEISELEEGASIRIIANSKNEARKMILDKKKHIEEILKRELTKEEIEGIYEGIRQTETVTEYVGPLGMDEEIRYIDMYRSTIHTLVKCIAMYEPEIVASNQLQEAKDFAYDSNDDWTKFAIYDAKPAFISILDASIIRENVKVNAAEIYFSNTQGMIIGNLRILGLINTWVVLSDTYTGPDKILCVAEKVNGNGQLHGNKILFPIKVGLLIESDFKAPTPEQLFSMLASVATKSTGSMDAFFKQLENQLEGIAKKHQNVQESSMKAIKDTSLKYLRDFSHYMGVEFDAEKKSSFLGRELQRILEKHRNRSLLDAEIIDAVIEPLTIMIKEIVEEAEQQEADNRINH